MILDNFKKEGTYLGKELLSSLPKFSEDSSSESWLLFSILENPSSLLKILEKLSGEALSILENSSSLLSWLFTKTSFLSMGWEKA